MSTIATATIEAEKQQRGHAFMQARKRLEQEYNCTVTIVPIWTPGFTSTFALAFDEQVMVGPAPPLPPEPEKGNVE